MAKTRVSNVSFASGASSTFGDTEAATLVGAAVCASAVGSAAVIGAMVVPAQVIGCLAIGGTLVALGETKKSTGSYIPFIGKDNEAAPKRPQVSDLASTAVYDPTNDGTGRTIFDDVPNQFDIEEDVSAV